MTISVEQYIAMLQNEPNIIEPQCYRQGCTKEACTEVTLVFGGFRKKPYKFCMEHYYEAVNLCLQLERYNLGVREVTSED